MQQNNAIIYLADYVDSNIQADYNYVLLRLLQQRQRHPFSEYTELQFFIEVNGDRRVSTTGRLILGDGAREHTESNIDTLDTKLEIQQDRINHLICDVICGT